MKTYKVIASEIVYSYCYVDAENEQEAIDKAIDNFQVTDWETLNIGDFQIEKAEPLEG